MNTSNYRRSLGWFSYAGCVATLVGCSLAPNYRRPDVSGANTPFKEETVAQPTNRAGSGPVESEGAWKIAQPSEEISRGEWWTVFGDPLLNELEAEALKANQDLKAAIARVKEARAI